MELVCKVLIKDELSNVQVGDITSGIRAKNPANLYNFMNVTSAT